MFKSTTFYYISDIKSIGGVLILEKLLKKKCSKEIYRAGLYLNEKMYKVDVTLYKKGEGAITNIYTQQEQEEILTYVADAIYNNKGNINKIIAKRKFYENMGQIEFIMAITCAINFFGMILQNSNVIVAGIGCVTYIIVAIHIMVKTKQYLRQ